MASGKNISAVRKKAAEKQIVDNIKVFDYDTIEYPIEVIVEKYSTDLEEEENDIYIPDYQREFIWSEKRRSKFIESILLGVPIPYIFLADVEGRKEVVDGSQRIRTLDVFVKDQHTIENLDRLTELNGFKFSDFDPVRQKRFLNKSLKMIFLSEKTDSIARQDLFERINTGSDELKPMEVLKGSQGGKFYSYLEECSKKPLFKKLCPISDKTSIREEGTERALRFFAYSESLEGYSGVVSAFMEKYMKKRSSNFSTTERNKLEKKFNDMLAFVDSHFPNGFKKNNKTKSTPRVRFEAISIGVSKALEKKPNLTVTNVDWLESEEFKHHTRSDAANNKSKLEGRINFVMNKLLGKV